MATPKTLISGVKPTGSIHVGNYFGAMRQFVDLQNDHDAFIFIADYHALTTSHVAQQLQQDIFHIAAAHIAIGLDPERVTFFQQSAIPAHTELAWIFNCITAMGYLERGHAYKDAVSRKADVSVGTFDYPMLMAADILLYDADVVPVGKDQKQHIEFARDTAGKFNYLYGDTFKQPEPLILADTETVPGIDGQKMSKSYGNTIPLFASNEEIESAVMRIKTDSKAPNEPKDTSDTLMQLRALVTPEPSVIEQQYAHGEIGYKEMKEGLIEDLQKYIAPFRDRYIDISKDRATLEQHIAAGNTRAYEIANKKIQDVRAAVGVMAF